MKKKYFRNWACSFVLILLVVLSIGGCRKLVLADNPDDGGDQTGEGGFAAYLPSGWQIGVTELTASGVDALVQQTQTIALSGIPLITEADIVGYDWDNQVIYFSDAAAQRLASYGLNSFLIQAVPIVITVDGERIYLGVIWPDYWSTLPTSPMFKVFESNGVTAYHMNVSAIDGAGENLIKNPRIYQALWQAGLLI